MIHLSLIERLRRQPDLRAHRRALHGMLNREFGVEIVAGLPEFGLGLLRPDGTAVELVDVLRLHSRVLVCGQPGSGRRLLLAAYMRDWIAASRQELPAPLPIDLASMDDERVSPAALLTAWTWSQATLAGNTGEQRGRWMLFASGWEHLPTARQAAWRLALCGVLPPAIANIVVVAPANERMWSGYTIVMPRQPNPECLVAWAERQAQPPALYALREGLAHYGQSWFAALLATLAARHGHAPATLADVYLLLNDATMLPAPGPAGESDPLSLGMASARASHQALLQRAGQIVAEQRFAELAAEPRTQRDTVAAIACGLMGDPAPL
ncbi:MAG TPA: hypothetical protein VFT99_02245, partial [Roseiflexaceae bacterium]|nr:hypothetical protein [Roseiflexaceae bacterium]